MKRAILITLFTLLLSMSATPVLAQTASTQIGGGTTGSSTQIGGGTPGSRLVNPIKANSLPELIAIILRAIVTIGTIFVTLALIYVGFLFVAAQGNAEKITSAKSALVWTVIGGLLLLGAEALSIVIKTTVEQI